MKRVLWIAKEGMHGMPYKTLVMSVNAYAGSEVAQAEPFNIKYSSRPCTFPGAICL